MKKIMALLLATVMVLSMAACGNKTPEPTKAATPDEAPTEGATEPVPYVPEVGEGVRSKISYTVSDEELLANRETVVATLADRELTLGTLQVYYQMAVFDFLGQYGAYMDYFGLNSAMPLDQQQYPAKEETWQQHFLTTALDNWHNYASLSLQGDAEKTPMDEELQKELDGLYKNLQDGAKEGKYESVDVMLQENVSPGVIYDDYAAFLSEYFKGYSYYLNRSNAIEVTDDLVEAYFEKNKDTLAESGITKEKGKVVNVRHILVAIEGGTTDAEGNTTYTDAEWAACEKEAQSVLDQWLTGEATEESFGKLAGICTDDPGSKETGGLYENVTTGQMVEPFDAWCFDESRKVGDYGLVKTDYGYHVMYYSGDTAQWLFECRNGAKQEKIDEFYNAALEAYESVIDYDKIMLGTVDLAG